MSFLYRFFGTGLVLYLGALGVLYGYQDKMIFHPNKLTTTYKFNFSAPFEELNLAVNGANLNGLRFRASQPKGAVLFLHGNAGSVAYWGSWSELFTALGYDFYVFDYRGFGKSSGNVEHEKDLYADTDAMMSEVLKSFEPRQIVLLGYSLGSGLAARLASKHSTAKLVLMAPYFKFNELASQILPFVPAWLVKYTIPTAKFIQNAPGTQVTIFHGSRDTLIPVSNSHRLASVLKPDDQFYELNSGHNDIFYNEIFREKLIEKLGE